MADEAKEEKEEKMRRTRTRTTYETLLDKARTRLAKDSARTRVAPDVLLPGVLDRIRDRLREQPETAARIEVEFARATTDETVEKIIAVLKKDLMTTTTL